MAIEIVEIKGREHLKAFAKFNIDLYKGCAYNVPELILGEVETLSADKNPAFDFCESIYFMAYENKKAVGRIAGIINHRANEKWGKKELRFGFVDFIDNREVSKLLFEKVEAWGREKGMERVIGPMGFTDMDNEGMLIEGFDQMSTMATNYNYPYYPEHIVDLGYVKDVDWLEYKITIPDTIPEKPQRVADFAKEKYGLHIINLSTRKELVQKWGNQVFTLLNEAYAHLYGYSALTEKQIKYYINIYFSMLRLDMITLIANDANELIGFGIAMPSMSKALRKIQGSMFPFGLLYLLWALKIKNNILDLYLVAVRPDYQNKGVNAVLFTNFIPAAQKNGYKYAESNPELETNEKVQSQWQYFEKEQHKRRRAFCKPL